MVMGLGKLINGTVPQNRWPLILRGLQVQVGTTYQAHEPDRGSSREVDIGPRDVMA